jgi:MarR family transcriptional regulator, organic hydroperoxide resistance regulator
MAVNSRRALSRPIFCASLRESSDESNQANDIADEPGITWGGTSKIVDRLEAAGLCRRRPNPRDRRSSLIDLTPAGTLLLAKARRSVEAELQTRLGPSMSDLALERFASTLAQLRHDADGRDAPVRAG